MATEVLDEVVRAKVPRSWKMALKRLAKQDAKPGEKPTESAPMRAALFEFFAKKKIKLSSNGKGNA